MNEKVCPQCGREFPPEQRFCPTDGSALRAKHGATDLVGTMLADRYLVLQTLGEGGMGRVYLAEHVRMGRKCALKVMNPKLASDADAVSRFNREAANACKISHPHVATVYDFGETSDGLMYLAMEYVEGSPLTRLVEQLGALPIARAATIAKQTADALAAAHELGIVHRDLKPDNIMITQNRDGSDCVKVVDFGIAKVADNDAQKVTKSGFVVGTPDYMSPEQLAGDKLDGRSDIYALAIVSFNMLTGKLPFSGDSQQEAMIMRLTDKPMQLSDVAPTMSWPAELQQVLDKALERDMRARYQNAAEFGRAFVEAIEGKSAGAVESDSLAGRVAPAGVNAATRPIEVANVPRESGARRLSDASAQQRVPATIASASSPRQTRPGFKSWLVAAILLLGVGGVGAAVWIKGGTSHDSTATGQVTDSGRSASDSVMALNNQLGGSSQTPSLSERLQRADSLTTPDTTVKESVEAQRVDSVRAVRALAVLDSAQLQLKLPSDSAYAQFLRAQALFAVKHRREACSLLKSIVRTALEARKARAANGLDSLLCAS